jgi:hypothetical protein
MLTGPAAGKKKKIGPEAFLDWKEKYENGLEI